MRSGQAYDWVFTSRKPITIIYEKTSPFISLLIRYKPKVLYLKTFAPKNQKSQNHFSASGNRKLLRKILKGRKRNSIVRNKIARFYSRYPEFSLATNDDIIISSLRKARKDLSYIIYFNCSKTRYYANKYLKSREELDSLVD